MFVPPPHNSFFFWGPCYGPKFTGRGAVPRDTKGARETVRSRNLSKIFNVSFTHGLDNSGKKESVWFGFSKKYCLICWMWMLFNRSSSLLNIYIYIISYLLSKFFYRICLKIGFGEAFFFRNEGGGVYGTRHKVQGSQCRSDHTQAHLICTLIQEST